MSATADRLTGPDPADPIKLFEIVRPNDKAIAVHATFDPDDYVGITLYEPPVVANGHVKRTAACIAISLGAEDRRDLAIALLATLPGVRITITNEENPS